jgi:uncharacterized protein YdaU (DUF1376 family)
MRIAVVVLALLVGACEGSFFSVGDRWHSPRVSEAFAARDACLARHAAESDGTEEVAEAARDVARDCAAETEKLVEISNRDGDAKVAANIRENSQFRARGYVLKARGQLVF